MAGATRYEWQVGQRTIKESTPKVPDTPIEEPDLVKGKLTIQLKAVNTCGESELSESIEVAFKPLPTLSFSRVQTHACLPAGKPFKDAFGIVNTSKNGEGYTYELLSGDDLAKATKLGEGEEFPTNPKQAFTGKVKIWLRL